MSQVGVGNLFLFLSMLCGAGAQVVLKSVLNETGPLILDSALLTHLSSYRTGLRIFVAVSLFAASFLSWLVCLSRLNLSYAYAVACSAAIFVSVFSVLFLGEVVSLRMWWGTILIVVGIVLLTPQA
jgi:drug/metabolite transporter (DMT)-like permease